MTTKVSAAERRYIVDGAVADVRADGRGRLDHRPVVVEPGVLPQANGSARVVLGAGELATTEAVACVRADVAALPERGSLAVAVHLPAAPGAEDAGAALSEMLQRLVGETLDLAALAVVPGRLAWALSLDVMVLEAAGNVADAVSMAAYAALNDARLPATHVVPSASEDGAADFEVDEDYCKSVPLDARGVPLCVTLAQLGRRFVVDPTEAEERCESCRVVVAVDREGALCGVQKRGPGSFAADALPRVADSAARIVTALLGQLDAALEAQRRPVADVFDGGEGLLR